MGTWNSVQVTHPNVDKPMQKFSSSLHFSSSVPSSKSEQKDKSKNYTGSQTKTCCTATKDKSAYNPLTTPTCSSSSNNSDSNITNTDGCGGSSKSMMTVLLYDVRFILLSSASFITIFSSIAIYFCLPLLISHSIRQQLTLSPSSGSFEQWKLNSVTDSVYLYNITNINEILSNIKQQKQDNLSSSLSNQKNRNTVRKKTVKPIIKQVGPFILQQERVKFNIRWEPKNETVLYNQRKRWTIAETSDNKFKDLYNETIYHMNIPLAGTSLLHPDVAEAIDAVVKENDLKLFMNHSVSTLLFNGYPDVLMEQAKALGHVQIDRFGWLYMQNNSFIENIRVFTGTSNASLSKFGSIDEINYIKVSDIFHDNNTDVDDTANVECNKFRFSSAGEFFPPPENSIISYRKNVANSIDGKVKPDNLSTKRGTQISGSEDTNTLADAKILTTETSSLVRNNIVADQFKLESIGTDNKDVKYIKVMIQELCRPFKLTYQKSLDFGGLKVNRYVADKYTFDYTDVKHRETNKCYCAYQETTRFLDCPPNGMMDLFNCKKGSSLTVSFPHFLHSHEDESLQPYLELFDDLDKPNEKEHMFFMDLDAELNIPVRAQIVMQFNIHYKHQVGFNFSSDYSFLVNQTNTNNQDGKQKMLNDFYLPQMWMKSYAQASESNLRNLKFIQNSLPYVTPATSVVSFVIASILLLASAKKAYDLTYGPASRKLCQHQVSDQIDSCKYKPMEMSNVQAIEGSTSSAFKQQTCHQLNHYSAQA